MYLSGSMSYRARKRDSQVSTKTAGFLEENLGVSMVVDCYLISASYFEAPRLLFDS